VIPLLSDADSGRRKRGIDVLGYLPAQSLANRVGELMRGMEDEAAEVRAASLLAYMALPEEELAGGIEDVVAMLDDPDTAVQGAAASVLDRVPTPRLQDVAAFNCINSDEGKVWATRALERISAANTVPTMGICTLVPAQDVEPEVAKDTDASTKGSSPTAASTSTSRNRLRSLVTQSATQSPPAARTAKNGLRPAEERAAMDPDAGAAGSPPPRSISGSPSTSMPGSPHIMPGSPPPRSISGSPSTSMPGNPPPRSMSGSPPAEDTSPTAGDRLFGAMSWVGQDLIASAVRSSPLSEPASPPVAETVRTGRSLREAINRAAMDQA